MLDGAASIFIGLVLSTTAVLLARETKSLLIGERADPAVVDSILKAVEAMAGITHANGIITIHLAPDQILVALSLEFSDELKTPAIEASVTELERRIRQKHPSVVTLFVKPQSSDRYREALALRYGKSTFPGGSTHD